MNSSSRTRLTVALTCTFAVGASVSTRLLAQGRIGGQVVDGTERRPVARQEVRLLAPKEGMEQAATTSTDASGRFTFDQSNIDSNSFYLLETRFQGAAYHAPVRFDSSGLATVNFTVYQSTPSPVSLRIAALRGLIRAAGAKVRVQEEFDLLNASDPPRAYVNDRGTFRVRLAPGAGEPSFVVVGLMNMPLPQTPERGELPGEFHIRYPLKPGMTQIAMSYETNYSPAGLELRDRFPYAIDQAEIYVSPSSLSLDSPLLKPMGLDAANNVQRLQARNLPANIPLELRLAGEAPATATSEEAQPGAEVKVVPNSMTRLGTPLLACFLLVLLWALGVRVVKERPLWSTRRPLSPAQKQLTAKFDALVNSLVDLDELFAAKKIADGKYWKERLELKARLVAMLKKAPPSLFESHATRNSAR